MLYSYFTFVFWYLKSKISCMNSDLYHERDIAIVAREIIDLYYENDSNSSLIESLSAICFSLSMIFEDNPKSLINWNEMYAYFDQLYIALNSGTSKPERYKIDKIYDQIKKQSVIS